MVYLVMYNVFNVIMLEFIIYIFEDKVKDVDLIVVVVIFIQFILEKVYLVRKDMIVMVCFRWFSQIEEGEVKEKGIVLGKKVVN